ncbi:2-oxo acid dehydrogenase subunit E2 [Buchnera aphidicola]|uniref:Dihydrolipoamide acetyltransferase component of pyruvate dehydrogenase complex n=1 Tax=Buchnera aphidicola subsp. Cinara cedri (strain Cc) TaxID=372461 RepID=Q057U1_BUCCC|nr:2-oxo acid dehydrogenase subunit E2 [Buchnera aphidicola]ABJ90608.1 pyruvate dehydrogenase E2 component (dihydrolipoamide acetyltransferase) [Buchnera aphidicola BCc]
MDVEVRVPDIGIKDVEVIEIFVKKGDIVSKEDSLISVEGHKSVLEIPSPISGIIKKICTQVGDKLSIDKLILIINNNQENNISKKNNKDYIQNSIDYLNHTNNNNKDIKYLNEKNNKNIHASPYIRRFARILDINLLYINGSGKKGRIVKKDIEKYDFLNKNINNNFIEKNNCLTELNTKNIDNKSINQPLTRIQRISGKNLLNNWNNIPHVTQFDEADITELEDFRKSYNLNQLNKNKSFQKVSLLSFLVKSVIHALLKYPRFNSILDKSKKNIIIKKDINIGIAVDTHDGLLVPVLKSLKNKTIYEISNNIFNVVTKTKNNQLCTSEMTDGSFTISSLGGIGGIGFTPIINAPEVCILGISKADIKPVWNKKKFYPRLILPFSISYDHRVIDGADGVRFTTFLKDILSDIRILLM